MRVKKVTHGFVIQVYDTETKQWVEQEFVAGDNCEYENDDNGEPVEASLLNDENGEEAYLPFNMVQPK